VIKDIPSSRWVKAKGTPNSRVGGNLILLGTPKGEEVKPEELTEKSDQERGRCAGKRWVVSTKEGGKG